MLSQDTCCLVPTSCPTLFNSMYYRLLGLCPWDSPGKNTGVGCHFLLQGIFPTQRLNLSVLYWQTDYLPLIITAHQIKTQFSPEPVPPTGSLHKPLILIHQRADRLKTTIREK